MKIVLVGESWGRHEASFKTPLVWWSGRELAKMLVDAKLAPKLQDKFYNEQDMVAFWAHLRRARDIGITNVFNAHPDGDRTEMFFAADGDQELPSIRIKNRVLRLRPEYRHHIDRLYDELLSLRPNVIVALGNFACWAVLGKTSIGAIRGTIQMSERLGIKCIPTYHPAALRDWSLRPTIVADLTKAGRESEYPEIRRIKRYAIAEDPRTKQRVTIAEIRDSFASMQSGLNYAVDIETGYALFSSAEIKAMPYKMKKILAEMISMVSFAPSHDSSVVVPFMTREDPELNYWSTPAEESSAWILVRDFLLNPNYFKTFQNGIFDISHFFRAGFRVFGARDDTMILQHALYPEQPKSLGYLGSLHSNEQSWKQMRASGESLKREE